MADTMLYNSDDKKIMQTTYRSLNKSRLQELVNFANNSGFKKLGIATCISMQKYAALLKDILEKNGFEVFMINCKESGLKNCEIIADGIAGPSCDPAWQADYLNRSGTELNINFGLCLGHGLIFGAKSKAPVTTFVVKDFASAHNPLAALSD